MKNGIKAKLTEKELNLILILKKNNGLKKSFLLKNIWNHSSDLETHAFETHLHRLRKKMNKFFKDNILTAENINAGIAVGLNKVNNKTQADSNRIQEQALVLQSQQDDLKNKLPNKQPMSPAVKYTLIGVGVIALVGIIYVIVKKKQ